MILPGTITRWNEGAYYVVFYLHGDIEKNVLIYGYHADNNHYYITGGSWTLRQSNNEYVLEK